MKYLVAGIVVLVIALLLWTLSTSVVVPGIHLPAADWMSNAGDDPASPPGTTGAGAVGADDSDPALADIPLDPEAIASLRGAREFGDPRMPPLERSAEGEQATPEELADPEKYAEFEARQDRKMKRAYVIEAERYVRQLRDDVARARTLGIPAEEIAKVEEKIRRIENMRKELLAKDPGLAEPAASP